LPEKNLLGKITTSRGKIERRARFINSEKKRFTSGKRKGVNGCGHCKRKNVLFAAFQREKETSSGGREQPGEREVVAVIREIYPTSQRIRAMGDRWKKGEKRIKRGNGRPQRGRRPWLN